MLILKNVDGFSAIKKSNEIIEICQPLSCLKITFFNHIRIFNNGARLSFSNRGDWLEHFFNKKYYNLGKYSKNYQCLTPGIMVWQCSVSDGVQGDAKNNFNIDHGITIIKKHPAYIDLYLFASTPDNYQINNFYINHLDSINHFINYYQDNSTKIIKMCKPDIPIIQNEDNHNYNWLVENVDVQQLEKFYALTNIRKYKVEFKGNLISISNREYQCIKLLLQGKSTKEISSLLNLSPRTVYFYVTNAKYKLGCSTKSQLLNILSDLL